MLLRPWSSMGELRRSLCACMAAQLLLLWSCGSAQSPGFLSIDCGSSASYTDPTTGLQWTADAAGLMAQGEVVSVEGFSAPLDTARVFTGNHSKYCYRLANSAVTAGAFFLVRAWLSVGAPPPYSPKSPDGSFQFKLLIDADEWRDVSFANASSGRPEWGFYEGYIRALHDSIDVCVARTTPNGDHPFISAIELRPLPSLLSATRLMSTTNLNFISVYHDDAGANGNSTRYPLDPFDRVWQSDPAYNVLSTINTIDTSNSADKLPEKVLHTAVELDMGGYTTWTYFKREVNGDYYCVFYFAEIDRRVNASGQRVFEIVLNGGVMGPIDVFKEAGGAFKSYETAAGQISTDQEGNIAFNFTAVPGSLYPPMFGATELFKASSKPFSVGTFPSDVMAIEDLKSSMKLSNYTGDPCLPIGFGYLWLLCVQDATSTGASRIKNISLSNRLTGGEIPKSISTLTMLDTILLGGNNLEGSIPDMSALANLQILDLSNNQLNGSIPKSLATLQNLKVLNLENNNLTGEIPIDLLQRQQASKLDFRFSGNLFCENSTNMTCTTLTPPSSSSKWKLNVGLGVGLALFVVFFVIPCSILAFFYLCKGITYHNLKRPFDDASTQNERPLILQLTSNPNQASKGQVSMLSIQELTFEEIKHATNNFSTQIGRGGFGPVYKGQLQNSTEVAIKISLNSSCQGSKEFLNEVTLLSRIHHKNLVDLLGFCKERELTLVYEYMSKGSLFDCIHGEVARMSPLSWSTRLNILVDAAQGLDYLHSGCHPRIIHRDIKSSNILVNDKLEAKISDFGISRSTLVGESAAPPTTLMGSMGYLDPEYLSKMILTEKVDIYSFGVLLLEVLCGKKPIFLDSYHRKETHIVDWVRPHIDCGAIDMIVDPSLNGYYNHSSIWKVLEVALACVQHSSDERPKMSFVYSELKEAQSIELTKDPSDMLLSTSTVGENSYAYLSLTHVQAR